MLHGVPTTCYNHQTRVRSYPGEPFRIERTNNVHQCVFFSFVLVHAIYFINTVSMVILMVHRSHTSQRVRYNSVRIHSTSSQTADREHMATNVKYNRWPPIIQCRGMRESYCVHSGRRWCALITYKLWVQCKASILIQ